ncbi:hypothetical protein CHLRE_17g726150v5 [Chlamydomonas reinhardtii]|uniref:AAA+ ATPase domain-containing protein n=1 Tax=Chlamydomonas reinhardtii TaxID=3055 RepID=A0A2K3CQN4_CHLRE|nr:uncharacterized protein CHLRE_17g726150v5 [Chlamydomonas reinhardtii]PNW70589.1 hypothetical protein CHLRE_17g726150v5 [Chlamydomonas reinhardtii]
MDAVALQALARGPATLAQHLPACTQLLQRSLPGLAAAAPAAAAGSNASPAPAAAAQYGSAASCANSSGSSSSTGSGKTGSGAPGHGRRGGWHGRGSWTASSSSHCWALSAAAAAAAAAAAVGSMSAVVLADAPGSSGPLRDAVAAASQALASAWTEVEEMFGRVNARLPSYAPVLSGAAPSAEEVHGALEVTVPIRDGADVDGIMQEMRQGFGRGSVSYSESVFGASRTVQLEVRPDPRRPEATVRMQLFVPPPGGSEQAQVVVSKRSAFTPDELAALKRLVLAANITSSEDRPARGARARRHGLHGGAGSEAEMEELNRQMEEALGELARGVFGGLLGGSLRHMFEELRRAGVPGVPGAQEGVADDDQGWGPFTGGPPSGPFGGGFPPGAGGGGGRGGYEAEAAEPPVRRPKVSAGSAGGHDWGSPAAARAVEQLLAMGAQVFPPGGKEKLEWGVLAGYDEQKRTIEDCLLLPLLRPDVYAKLARATRKTYANNRPRAVLFEGPPGTGKTTSARVISSQAAVPLIYLPLEAVLSKWYGQSEQQLGQVFKAAEALGGAIIFLDELDALGGNREEGGMHEVSRRLLSVLLREMEGFDAETKKTVVIGATNRKTDLDPALLSRFDLVLSFGLPDAACRKLILKQYAQQLSDSELGQLAERTPGMSGRDLRDVCEHTERRWASKIIRGEVREEELPPLREYLASAAERASAVQAVQAQASSEGALRRLMNGGGAAGGLPGWFNRQQ